ncbi:AcrR family transcriptional regulator [Saonia flava]|uniref:AcrR family transcriptional regulator n=1 Tax=Saonia flava TaxID=523696 RepID=A0A846QZT6_9FLAO|nr:TetR/AcrR family transcriptional regulator [Saonia flava]NJB70119.1 AcrR family transcriptional regulator [Saonia flava]
MKKVGVKERIIEAASHLFYFEGYNQTGINKILKEANASKDSMYRYFRSKEDIAVAYLVRRHTMWMGKLNDCVAKQNTPKGKVIGCFDYLVEWLTEVHFRGCGWQNIIVDLPEGQQKIKDQAIYHKNELRSWIHDLLAQENQYSQEQAQQLGDEVLILIEGAIILSQIQKNSWPIETAKRSCVKLLS